MAVFVVGLVFILALAGYSDANYCVCNSGLSDSVLQKSIDYACGAGADCSQILQNGPCFNPNTVKDHCNYAVNSYYQKKGNAPGSCDFSGTATVVPNPPSVASGCVFPSSASNAGGTTPSTAPPTGLTPTTPTPPASPTIGGGGAATPTTPGTFPGSTTPPGSPLTPGGFGLAPAGSGFGNTDSGSVKLLAASQSSSFMLVAVILISSLFSPMI
ncbi:plasmodesmata callose-binding protein 3 [Perilla frutescens var. hirtella]|uniref:Plasmodesmata callose-binding protein 3 n=1 Tax=Perilla frutescens var. hirtella TaxID=608512 RepID=A0AAD4IXN3_PERFH|nr:plasmodesmata callose-binding protein 3 [Perilla frutescens var. hirtella]